MRDILADPTRDAAPNSQVDIDRDQLARRNGRCARRRGPRMAGGALIADAAKGSA
jgi:hypothetical protein